MEFILTSVRSEGQFNTIIYSEEDVYRNQQDRHVLFMHPKDIALLNLEEGALVDVVNATGAMEKLRLNLKDFLL